MPPDDFAPKPRQQQFRVIDQAPPPVDHRTLEDAVMRAAEPPPPRDPTDTEYVAISIDRLRYLDLKSIAKAIMGDKKVETPAELADLTAEWAAANKMKVPA